MRRRFDYHHEEDKLPLSAHPYLDSAIVIAQLLWNLSVIYPPCMSNSSALSGIEICTSMCKGDILSRIPPLHVIAVETLGNAEDIKSREMKKKKLVVLLQVNHRR